MNAPHIADAEDGFLVVNITPDFCIVDDKVVPFEIYRELSHEKDAYAKTLHARGRRVLKMGSVIEGVKGDMGKGVISGTSKDAGDVLMIEGASTVRVEGQLVCRHNDLCRMNGK